MKEGETGGTAKTPKADAGNLSSTRFLHKSGAVLYLKATARTIAAGTWAATAPLAPADTLAAV